MFKLEFTVYNGAGMKTSHEESVRINCKNIMFQVYVLLVAPESLHSLYILHYHRNDKKDKLILFLECHMAVGQVS